MVPERPLDEVHKILLSLTKGYFTFLSFWQFKETASFPYTQERGLHFHLKQYTVSCKRS
jgi:hypothetical protein